MSRPSEASKPPKDESGGLLHRLFGRPGGQKTVSSGHRLQLDDIQGIILRMYRMPVVRHFLLKVIAPAAARKLLGRLVSGDETDAPQITTAHDWHVGMEPGPGDDLAAPARCKPDFDTRRSEGYLKPCPDRSRRRASSAPRRGRSR